MKRCGLHKNKWQNYLKKIEEQSTSHIQNIYKDEELSESSVCSFFEHTAEDGKKYNVQYYNLDMIISVGYRVKSQNGILF